MRINSIEQNRQQYQNFKGHFDITCSAKKPQEKLELLRKLAQAKPQELNVTLKDDQVFDVMGTIKEHGLTTAMQLFNVMKEQMFALSIMFKNNVNDAKAFQILNKESNIHYCYFKDVPPNPESAGEGLQFLEQNCIGSH